MKLDYIEAKLKVLEEELRERQRCDGSTSHYPLSHYIEPGDFDFLKGYFDEEK